MKARKMLALAMAAAVMFCAAACGKAGGETPDAADDGKFRVGMECDYAPFNWTQSEPSDTAVPIEGGAGYADGYDVQLAKQLAEAMGKELVVVKIEWDGLTLALQSGKIDAIIAGMSPTEKRRQTIDFSDIYYNSDFVMMVKRGSSYEAAQSLEDFRGAKVSAQMNTTWYDSIDQIPEVQKQMPLATMAEFVIAVRSGKVDAVVLERPGAMAAQLANEDITYITFAEGKGFEVSPEDVSVAVGVRKTDGQMLEQINAYLKDFTDEEKQEQMAAAIERQPLTNED
ncbi:transporter substrate-binding domain-containing protein [Christensenellaceae bacterium 44-20]